MRVKLFATWAEAEARASRNCGHAHISNDHHQVVLLDLD